MLWNEMGGVLHWPSIKHASAIFSMIASVVVSVMVMVSLLNVSLRLPISVDICFSRRTRRFFAAMWLGRAVTVIVVRARDRRAMAQRYILIKGEWLVEGEELNLAY